MPGPRRAAPTGPETVTDASPGPERPEKGQIIQVKVDDSEQGWRPAIVVSWLEGDEDVEWAATCQVFLATADHPFDHRSRMWADGHNSFIEIDPTNFGDTVGRWFQP